MADNYFGIRMGDAISAGAGHIASGLQRRYELQRQEALRQEALAREQAQRDQQMRMQFAGQGMEYDPNNPQAALDAFISQSKSKRQMEQQGAQLGQMKTMAEIEALNRRGTDDNAELRRELLRAQIESLRGKTATPPTTPAEKSVDTAFGKDYAEYVAAGGYGEIQTRLAKLRNVMERLKSGEKISGPIISLMPEALRSRVLPGSMTAQQDVEETVQRTLRQTLGAQFTQKEGEMFMKRGFDPRLSEEENAKKLEFMIQTLETMAQAKQSAVEYYEKNGTLKGYTGALPGTSGAAPQMAQPSGLAPDRAARLAELRKKKAEGTLGR